MKTASARAKTTLDAFLSEEVIQRVTHPESQIVIDDVITESNPAPAVHVAIGQHSESSLWPFFAAALVAAGVTLLAFALADRYVHF